MDGDNDCFAVNVEDVDSVRDHGSAELDNGPFELEEQRQRNMMASRQYLLPKYHDAQDGATIK